MNSKKKKVIASVFIAILCIYGGYVIASCTDESGILSLNSVIQKLPERLNSPFFFCFTSYSAQGILYGGALGIFLGAYYYYTRKNWRFREECGSARWGNAAEITKKLTEVPKGLTDAPYERILSANLRMNMSDRVTDLNNNILLVAGPGKGKTFRIISPNILCCNGSIVVTDPKKELLRTYGNYLKEHGYEVKVIDLIDFELSDCYNPFCHIRSRNDIPELISLLWDSMEDVKAQKGDPVWDDSAKSLIEGFAYYMFYEMEPEKRTFRTLASLLTDLSASDKGIKNMTKTMQALLQSEPAHPAAVKFLQAMNGADNTVKSVLFSATAKMSKLEDEKLLKIFDHDTIDFAALGMGYGGDHKKTALFFCISDGDTRWNFVVSIAVMQVFKELYYAADHYCADRNGKLPIPVSCWLDEFRNVPLPNSFPKLLSTMRGRNISSIITIQDPSQLEGLYDKENRTVRGDCSTIIYMGGNEHETHKWISEMLGKETVDKRSTSLSRGSHGSESRSDDVIARDLMAPDEVRKLSNKKQIVFVEGYDPVMDDKYMTQYDPRFREAKKLGHYTHIPDRGSESVETEKQVNDGTEKEILFKSLSAAEAEQLKKNGVKTIKVSEDEEKPDYDLSEMENYESLTEEKKLYLINLMAEEKVTKAEILAMFSGDIPLTTMQKVIDTLF